MQQHEPQEEFSFKNYLVPLTTAKAITWIIVLGLIVYANMLFNDFVWDDIIYIVHNPQIHSLNIFYFFQNNSFNMINLYRPLTMMYFAILYQLFNTSTFFYHFLQLCIQIIDCILLFFIFNKFFAKPISFFLSLIFLVHPMQVESVSFISSADSPLFFLFGAIAMLLIFRKSITIKTIIAAFILTFISLLVKETGIVFLILAIISIYFYHKKYTSTAIIAGIITFAVYSYLRFAVGKVFLDTSSLHQVIPIQEVNFLSRVTNIPSILLYYFQTFIFPYKLSIDQQWIIPSIDIAHFYIPLIIDAVIFIGILLLGIYLYYKKQSLNSYIFFSVCLIGGMGLTSQIVPLEMTVADRWFYLPMIGLLGLIGIVYTLVVARIKQMKIIFLYVAIVWLLLLSIRTIVRNSNWSNNLTLLSHDSQVNDNYDLEFNLGGYLADNKQYAQALIHTKKSADMFPIDLSLYNLGKIYEQLNNDQEAKYYYIQALTTKNISPTHVENSEMVYESLANMYVFNKNPVAAAEILIQAVSQYPNSANLWELLAISYYELHKKSAALFAMKQAVRLNNTYTTNRIYVLISKNQLKLN